MKTLVVALGGNALLQRGEALTAENQYRNIASAVPALVSPGPFLSAGDCSRHRRPLAAIGVTATARSAGGAYRKAASESDGQQ